MKILFIEDDYSYFADLKRDIEDDSTLAGPDMQIRLVESERQFVDEFEQIAEAGYDFAIVDVMVKWEGREPDRRRPDKEVREGGYYRAGFRCLDRLRADERTQDLRIVVHSNLDERQMGEYRETHNNEYTKFVPKSGSPEPLLDVLHQWMAAPTVQDTGH